jgi:hypothetical protein
MVARGCEVLRRAKALAVSSDADIICSVGRRGPGAKLTLLLLVWAAAACNEDVWALVHPPEDGGDAPAPVLPDAQADRELPVDASADPEPEPDAEITWLWTGQIEGTGFDDYAGLTVYGRVGSLSHEVASSTVDPDGSFVLRFQRAIPILDSSIVYLFIDVTEDGACHPGEDYVGFTLVRFFEFPQDFEVRLVPEALLPALSCLHFT